MTRDDVIKALSLCRYDPDPGQECKQLVSCDICPYWSDETGCRMTDLFTDAIALLKEEPRRGKWVKIHGYDGYVTPGGDPVWGCSECGKGIHVYGIEHTTYGADVSDGQWLACPNCGALMEGEDAECET